MTQQFPGSEFPSIPGDPLILEPLQKSLLAMTYGVHIIGSTSVKNEHNLMIADWVMQVSFQPRLVAVSIENDARTLRFIQETKSFTVNLLHQLDGIDLARAVVMPSEGKKITPPQKGPVKDTIEEILGGLRSACTYAGARSLKSLSKCTTFVKVNRQLNEVFS